jgi:hypothetical protein
MIDLLLSNVISYYFLKIAHVVNFCSPFSLIIILALFPPLFFFFFAKNIDSLCEYVFLLKMMTLKLLVAVVLLKFAFVCYIYDIYDLCGSTGGKSSFTVFLCFFFFRVKHFRVIFMIFRVYVKFTLQVLDEMFE